MPVPKETRMHKSENGELDFLLPPFSSLPLASPCLGSEDRTRADLERERPRVGSSGQERNPLLVLVAEQASDCSGEERNVRFVNRREGKEGGRTDCHRLSEACREGRGALGGR